MIYAITPENRAFVPLLRRAAVSDTARHLRKGKRLEGIRAPLDLRNGSIRRRRGNLYPCGRRRSGHCRLPALPNDAATHAFERFSQLVEGEVPQAPDILGTVHFYRAGQARQRRILSSTKFRPAARLRSCTERAGEMPKIRNCI